MKKNTFLFLTLVVALTGCNKNANTSSEEQSDSVEIFDANENLDLDHVFFDDFTDGINPQYWSIGHEKWGLGNNGVISQNVNYTKDGVVVLQANGDYYAGDLQGINSTSGTRTGSAIITRDTLGPGRYEARMKCMPRFGATSAMWTFYFDEKTAANHEIDIELNIDDFNTSCFTNWTTEENKVSKKIVDKSIVHNDGQWHDYKFEWHTNPERVDYYVDNELLFTATAEVPNLAGRLWIGNWFPNSWAGTPDFETDYMFLDYFRYTPYLNNPFVATTIENSPHLERYPSAPIDSMPINNLISNPSLEGNFEAYKKDIRSNVRVEAEVGRNNSNALIVPYNDIAYQMITGIDDSFDMTFTAYVKYDSTKYLNDARVLFEYRPLETTLLGSEELLITKQDVSYVTNEYYKIEKRLTLPKGTQRIELSFIGGTQDCDVLFDDMFLNLTSKIEATK